MGWLRLESPLICGELPKSLQILASGECPCGVPSAQYLSNLWVEHPPPGQPAPLVLQCVCLLTESLQRRRGLNYHGVVLDAEGQE